ncbi:MAG TPA: methylamine dehydrogenase light chain [Steroidobacteraceae bacterium]|nr:methylamine dehydrogenase light chain [Steroidobacteraceae bacterium]
MKWFDEWIEDSARAIARRSGRRSFIAKLSATLFGAATLPLLPIARGAETPAQPAEGTPNDPGDPTTCEYWRYCGIDGYLCSCCGGSHTSCPPGSTPAPVTWVGTCHNPAENRDYVVSYNDCCGKTSCGRCLCNRNEGDLPLYAPFLSNDYNWCVGSKTDIAYHCTVSRIVGLAK